MARVKSSQMISLKTISENSSERQSWRIIVITTTAAVPLSPLQKYQLAARNDYYGREMGIFVLPFALGAEVRVGTPSQHAFVERGGGALISRPAHPRSFTHLSVTEPVNPSEIYRFFFFPSGRMGFFFCYFFADVAIRL